MPIVRKSKAKPRVLVVVHDAGEAEIIGAYMQRYPQRYAYRALATAAAARVFKRRGIRFSPLRGSAREVRSALRAYPRPDLVLLGTGDGPPVSWKYAAQCRERGIKTAGYLEHWVRYRERFGYPRAGWKKHLPDALWVGDSYALRLARRSFPGRRIKLVPNEYLREVWREYKKKPASRKPRLLYVSSASKDDCSVLEDTLTLVAKYRPDVPVRVRLHPQEREAAYRRLIARYAGKIDVRVTKNNDILSDLRAARLVVGVETMALVVALHCGKKTVSIMPGRARCPLPFRKIRKLRRVEKLRQFLK